MPMNPEAGVEAIKHMSQAQLADELDQFRMVLDMLKDELRPGRVREIRETTKTARAFLDEMKRQGLVTRGRICSIPTKARKPRSAD